MLCIDIIALVHALNKGYLVRVLQKSFNVNFQRAHGMPQVEIFKNCWV